MDDDKTGQGNNPETGDVGRRDFVAFSLAAGLTAGSGSAAGAEVTETDVEIKTPDGTCDAAFFHPEIRRPSRVFWSGPTLSACGPPMRDIGRRLAADGYSVLVPNPFYRVAKAPFTDASNFNFQNPDDMAKLRPLMASVNAPGNAGERCRRVRRFPRCAKGSQQGKEDRHPGLLHGRTAGSQDTPRLCPIASARAHRSTAAVS